MLWGTTSIGLSLPWADIGEGIDRLKTGLLVGKSLWLWLGVLDAIQGVGFGMMLLQVCHCIIEADLKTLTRMHIAFTLITAQVLGSIATIVARAVAPDNVGPGDVFPDFSSYAPGDSLDVFKKAWFYIGLFSQILICVGYFLFFRKV
jgi:alpha-1,3-glucan synthase